jgi:hypothetical protein
LRWWQSRRAAGLPFPRSLCGSFGVRSLRTRQLTEGHLPQLCSVVFPQPAGIRRQWPWSLKLRAPRPSCGARAFPSQWWFSQSVVVGAPTTRFQIWRSWCGGWATHRRLHLDTQSYCFFGCNHSEDSFEHYIVCPSMWFVIQQCTATPRPRQTPLERLGLAPGMDDDARLHALKQLAVATALYNSMRGEPSLRLEVSRAKVTRDLARLWRVLTPVATDQAFSHGGRELARRAAFP